MIDLLKKSAACAFAIISAVFTFVPEAIFGKVILISEDVLKQFTLEGYMLLCNGRPLHHPVSHFQLEHDTFSLQDIFY